MAHIKAAVTIAYEARRGRGGSATGGESISSSKTTEADFQTVVGSLHFADGESGPKFFSVPIANDDVVEASFETFEVILDSVISVVAEGNPTPNATIGNAALHGGPHL